MNRRAFLAPKAASLEKTCEVCPAQWEGKTTDGQDLYVRFRWGTLEVYVGDAKTDGFYEIPLFRWEDDSGGWSGTMTTGRMLELTGIQLEPGVTVCESRA